MDSVGLSVLLTSNLDNLGTKKASMTMRSLTLICISEITML